MKPVNYFLIFLICLGLSSCNLDYFKDAEFGEFVWDASLAIPLGEIEYSVSELFSELDNGGTVIQPNDDELVSLIYEQQLGAQSATEFLEILDQTFQGEARANTDIDNSPVEQTIQSQNVFEYELSRQGDEAYDSIYFNAGNLGLSLNSTIPYDVSYTILFKSLAQNQIQIERTGTLQAFQNAQDEVSLVDVVGLLHLDASGNPSSNSFIMEVNYELLLPVGGDLDEDEGIEFTIDLRNVGFSDLFGNIGTQQLSVDLETLDLDFFDIFAQGDIRFASPNVDFSFYNSFGFPLGIDYSNISARASDGSTIALSGTVTQELQLVEAPILENSGTSVESNHSINVSNSNIDQIFSSKPSAFRIGLSAQSNPNNAPAHYNFMNELNTLEATAKIEIPLDMAIEELIANQEFDFKNADALEQAKRALLRINATNEMPLGGDLEIQFLDADGNIIYSIDERPVFVGAEVGPDGRTIGTSEQASEILLDNEALRVIETAARINIRASLSSTGAAQGLEVKFYDDYTLNLAVALQADVELNSNGQ